MIPEFQLLQITLSNLNRDWKVKPVGKENSRRAIVTVPDKKEYNLKVIRSNTWPLSNKNKPAENADGSYNFPVIPYPDETLIEVRHDGNKARYRLGITPYIARNIKNYHSRGWPEVIRHMDQNLNVIRPEFYTTMEAFREASVNADLRVDLQDDRKARITVNGNDDNAVSADLEVKKGSAALCLTKFFLQKESWVKVSKGNKGKTFFFGSTDEDPVACTQFFKRGKSAKKIYDFIIS